jgi:hypothetical protein
MNFFVTKSRVLHLARHFVGSGVAGSLFDAEIFPSIESLIAYINRHEPFDVMEQSAHSRTYLFRHIEGRDVGANGIAKKEDIPEENIALEIRDGYHIKIGLVDKLPKTKEFCVVAIDTNQGRSVITIFPGMYAPPFPSNRMTGDDFLRSQTFWQKFILVKADKTLFFR